MFSTIWSSIKELVRKMIGPKTVESVLHITPIVSTKMVNALDLWDQMYRDESPWLKEATVGDPVSIKSLGLATSIASEKARTAVLELSSTISVPMQVKTEDNPNYQEPTKNQLGEPVFSGEPPTVTTEKPMSSKARANFLNDAYQKEVLNRLRPELEFGIAYGGLVIKPYIVMGPKTNEQGEKLDMSKVAQIRVEFIHADSFFPLSFNSDGQITEAVFVQTKLDKDCVYHRLEHHTLNGNTVTVENRAFKSTNTETTSDISQIDLGTEISLKEVTEWKNLQKSTKVANVDKLLFGYFKMPDANNIDPYSPLGISGFSRAVSLIEQADRQYSRLLWEYQATEAAIDIDRDALSEVTDKDGNVHYTNPILQARLFRPIDLGDANTYKVFTPNIRDTSLIAGLNQLLMKIEDVCSISRGTLSQAATEARTATEIKVLKQRSYSANLEIQKSLENALRDVVYVMNTYCDLYEITNSGKYEVSFEWDDSIITDMDTELSKRLTLMQNGLAGKVETRMWYFGESEMQAREALKNIDQENQQAMEQNLKMQSLMSGAPNLDENSLQKLQEQSGDIQQGEKNNPVTGKVPQDEDTIKNQISKEVPKLQPQEVKK